MVFLECFFPFLLPFSSKVRLREDSPPLFGRFSSSSMDFLPFLECFFLEFFSSSSSMDCVALSKLSSFSSSSSMDFCSEREVSTCSMVFLECFFPFLLPFSSKVRLREDSPPLFGRFSSSSMDFLTFLEFFFFGIF